MYNKEELQKRFDELLKISPCKFWGPNPNEVGNFCIVGHNYRSDKFFSNVPELEDGDIIEITDLSDRTLSYEGYDKYVVEPDDVRCTSQRTNGMKEITIITCTDDSKHRVIVKQELVNASFISYDAFIITTRFIDENGHLPDIPSEQDVINNGYDMVEMDGILLKKIEELTLYTIELNDIIKRQQEIIETLQSK